MLTGIPTHLDCPDFKRSSNEPYTFDDLAAQFRGYSAACLEESVSEKDYRFDIYVGNCPRHGSAQHIARPEW